MFLLLLLLPIFRSDFCRQWLSLLYEDLADYSAVVGGQVTLPCNTTPPSPDDGVVLVFWYQEVIANPIYTIDARTTPLAKAKHFTHHSYENRVTFNVTDPISYFKIKPVKDTDGGQYRCRVSECVSD